MASRAYSLAGADIIKSLLQVEKIRTDVYRGVNLKRMFGARSVYGGQIVAQTLRAATESTNGDYSPHSLHCYFIKPVRDNIPIEYYVERVRDGASVATRAVRAVQKESLVFHMIASYQKPESLPVSHQDEMPQVMDPEKLKSLPQLLGEFRETYKDLFSGEAASFIEKRVSHYKDLPFDVVPVDPELYFQHRVLKVPTRTPADPNVRVWYKLREDISLGEGVLMAYVTAFFSDWGTISPAWFPHPDLNIDFATSLDHSIWFHEQFEPGEWLLYDCECPKFNHGRSLSLGRIWTKSGRLVASFAQEGLTRGTLDNSKL